MSHTDDVFAQGFDDNHVTWEEFEQPQLPDGLKVRARILEIKEKRTQAGALAYQGTYEIVEPAEYQGTRQWDSFLLGTTPRQDDPKRDTYECPCPENDPDAVLPETRKKSFGMRRLRTVLIQSETPLLPSLQATFEAAKQRELFMDVAVTKGKDGVERTNFRNYRSVLDRRAQAGVGGAQVGGSPYTLR